MLNEIEIKDFVDPIDDVIERSRGRDWWDGPSRFDYVNRNIVSWIQGETLCYLVSKFSPGPIGYDIGGSGHSAYKTFAKTLNIEPPADVVADGANLPFKDNSVDYIVNSHTLEHIENTEAVLVEWIRVLKPKGLLLSIVPDKNHFLHNPEVTENGKSAVSEMSPDDAYKIVEKFIDKVEVISFNNKQSNFDFEILLRKK